MANLTGNDILARAATMLLDQGNDQWTAPELLSILNAGIAAITTVNPDDYVLTIRYKLAKGTLQNLPTGFKTLKEITRNLGANGVTPGRPCRLIQKRDMDRTGDDWHNAPQAAEVDCYMHDNDNKFIFWVYPPQKFPPQYVEIVGPAVPPRLTAASEEIPIGDENQDALLYYVLAHCYGKNAKRGDVGKFNLYLSLCMRAAGMSGEAEKIMAAAPPQES